MITAHGGSFNSGRNSNKYLNHTAIFEADAIEVDIYKMFDVLYISHWPAPFTFYKKIRLREVFKLVKETGLKVNCDLKTHGIISDVIKLAKSMGVENQLIFTGCVSEEDSKIIDCGEAWFNHIKGIKYKAKNARALKERIDSYDNPHFVGINLNYHRVNAKFIEACQAVGLKLSVFTVDDIEALLRLVPVINGNITTNLPLVARSILNKMRNSNDKKE